MYYKRQTGIKGEDIAIDYLKKEGYKILERNFRCKQGEIDIIAEDKDEIVFIEVKARSNINYGMPSEAVNLQKKKHILGAIKYYNYIRKIEKKFIRIDVIEVYIKKCNVYINHIKQAID